jgi:hypothetical protein
MSQNYQPHRLCNSKEHACCQRYSINPRRCDLYGALIIQNETGLAGFVLLIHDFFHTM